MSFDGMDPYETDARHHFVSLLTWHHGVIIFLFCIPCPSARRYAKGFIRNKPGTGKAVVSGLDHGVGYFWKAGMNIENIERLRVLNLVVSVLLLVFSP